MAGTQSFYYRIGVGVAAFGVVLLVLALAQALFDFALFGTSPYLVGIGMVVAGAMMAVSAKKQANQDKSQS